MLLVIEIRDLATRLFLTGIHALKNIGFFVVLGITWYFFVAKFFKKLFKALSIYIYANYN